MEIAGAVILGLVVLQMLLFGYSSLRQLRGAERQRRTEQQLLARQIGAANALRRQREQLHLHWNGFRKFVVSQIVDEADRVRSFYLTPHDGKPLPAYPPGQYLTFRLEIPEQDKPVIRCYSLSDSPSPEHYRVTIKQAIAPSEAPNAPPGLVSTYFHERLKEGDILDVQAPRGHFTLDPADPRPAVLIAGGVGITPLFCMARCVAEAGTGREVHLLYGVRHGGEHALRNVLEELNQLHENIHIYNWYSHPREVDVRGTDFQFDGHITVDQMQEIFDSSNYQFYLCGPPPMMSALIDGLKAMGVPKGDIHTEAFGAPTVKKAFPKPPVDEQDSSTAEQRMVCKVTFGRSGKTCSWDESCPNLLDFAVQNGVSIDSGCRAGNCATCLVAIKSGQVEYVTEHGAEPEEGTCLTCIAVPKEDLTLDA